MTLPQIFFAYFAVALTGLSLLVVTRRNPVHGVMWMLILFIHVAGLYLFLNAEFLAAIQIIVYAGAILVLYLFVVMLLNLKKIEKERKFQHIWIVGLLVSVAFLTLLIPLLGKFSVYPPPGEYSVERINSEGQIMTVGRVLYTKFLLPFEIASLILLVSIIGAVVLSKRKLN
ncbi:MAG: NADH-quinone oxidoreductase subunit J [Nitrospirae bacterium]|nr:NADH-quinone oxidoreductase subunit J [Nitrospirota bacterium]